MNSINKQLTLGSLFDGSGTCPLTATLCDIKPLWASEIEKFPIQVTSKRFPNMKHLGDITKINGADIEPVDIITFGSPCTNLSVAGKQNGFNITFNCFGANNDLKEPHFSETTIANNNTKYLYEMECPICGSHLTQTNESALFFNAIRIIREMREATNNEQPRFIMWENVPGAFSSNKGSDFRKVLEEITETEIPMPQGGKWANAGMVELSDRQLAWRVLDAQYWGVPQRRKRIFLVTDFRGKCAREILFKPESLFGNIEKGREEREGTATDFERCIGKTSTESRGIVYSFDSLASNSMKSKNPHSGCRRVDIAKTIDTTTQDPSKNQGGIAVLTYDARGNGDGNICCTITGDHQNRITDYTALAVNQTVYGFCPDNSITAGGVTCEEEKIATLSTTKRMGVAFCLQSNKICRVDKNDPQDDSINEDVSSTLNSTDYQEGVGTLKSSGRDCGGSETILASGKAATGTLMANCSTKLWLGNQEAFSGDYSIIQNKQVRRLMPIECARLQGFPDWWCADIPHSDTAEYKMWGNGMALPCVLYIMQNIADAIN